jgi:hypothetical protein
MRKSTFFQNKLKYFYRNNTLIMSYCMSLEKKYLLASLLVYIVASSSVLLIAQQPVLAASDASPGTTIPLTTNAENTNIEADSATSVNNQTRSYAEQIMAYCKNDSHCPVLALDFVYNKTESRQIVLGTFLDLVQLYDENYYTCHDPAHHLGMWLYSYTTNLKEAISYAKPLLCGGAVLHGIFQSYFVSDQVQTIDKNQTGHVNNVDKNQIMITNLCPVGQEDVNWIYERDCIHGIGHGLAELYNYNTTAAVDRCNEFEPEWAQSACSRGVFMQNMLRYLETGEGNFDKNDIYFPCDKTVEKFAPQCYYYQVPYLLEANGYDPTATFAQCDNISPSEFAKYCYQGMGRKLQGMFVYGYSEQAIEYCYLGNQSSYHDDCLIGLLRTVLKGDTKPDIGFQLCSLSRSDFKAECHEAVGMWIKMLLNPNQQELESVCSKARDIYYVVNCINANPETSIQVTVFEPYN